MKNLEEHLKTKQFAHIYLLTGEETYLVHQYRDRLIQALLPEGGTMNLSRFEGTGIEPAQIIDLAETAPFFSEHRVITLEQTGFLKNGCDALAEYIKSLPEYTTLIFVDNQTDKRNKLYKQIGKLGCICTFPRQTERVLVSWIMKSIREDNKKITQRAMDLFLTKTGDDMLLIRSELDKLLSYTLDKDSIDIEDVEAVCSGQLTDRIFAMIDAIGNQDRTTALSLYYDLLALKVAPMKILSLIGRQFRNLIVIKDMIGKNFHYDQMAQTAGVPQFAAKKYASQARLFTLPQLKKILASIAEAEEGFKTGRIEDQIAVELLIVELSKNLE